MSTYLVSYLLRLVGMLLFFFLFYLRYLQKSGKCFVYGEKVNSLVLSLLLGSIFTYCQKSVVYLAGVRRTQQKWPLPAWLCDTKVDWTNTVCPKSEECPNLPARHEEKETTPVNIHISHYWYCMWPHIGFTMLRPKIDGWRVICLGTRAKTSYRSTNNCSYISRICQDSDSIGIDGVSGQNDPLSR